LSADFARDDERFPLPRPDFSSMVEVQENMSRLSDDDRKAIAAYLKAVPALK
jgi:hypothetical protein